MNSYLTSFTGDQHLFIYFFAPKHGLQELSSLTRDGTSDHGSEPTESQLMDCQGVPTR